MNKFNLKKFNLKSTAVDTITGVSDIEMNSYIANYLVEIYPASVISDMTIDSTAAGIVEVYGVADEATIELNSTAIGTAIVFAEPTSSDLYIDSLGVGSLLGEEYIELTGLTLLPGHELEINICDLTATINGENAMHLLSNNGYFFDLLPGNNYVEVTTTGSNNVSVDAYWKDRWL